MNYFCQRWLLAMATTGNSKGEYTLSSFTVDRTLQRVTLCLVLTQAKWRFEYRLPVVSKNEWCTRKLKDQLSGINFWTS